MVATDGCGERPRWSWLKSVCDEGREKFAVGCGASTKAVGSGRGGRVEAAMRWLYECARLESWGRLMTMRVFVVEDDKGRVGWWERGIEGGRAWRRGAVTWWAATIPAGD